MNINAMRNFRLAHEKKAGGNNLKAHESMNSQIKEWINKGELDANRISFRAMLEAMTDFNFSRAGSNTKDAAVKMSEAISGSSFPVLTNTILNSVVMPAFDLYSETLLSLVTEGNARTTEPEKIAGTTALGQLDRRLEKQAYKEDDFDEKDVEIYKSDFGKMISLTFETLYNDETGMIMDRARTVGETGGQHIHKMITETVEGLPRTAFNESASKAFVYKGVAYGAAGIYQADHSAIDNVANPNDVTGGISELGLENAYNAFGLIVDSRGNQIIVSPNGFLHHQTKTITVRKILHTAQAIPDGNAAATAQYINPFGPVGGMGASLNPIPTPLMNTTYSYLGDFKKALVWLWVERPNTVVAPPNTNLAFEKRIVYRARFNYFGGVGLRDYRYIVRLLN